MIRAIVGANWGDEGKGKITDVLAKDSDIVVRFQGGANAGHTIINQYGKLALHLLPSGICYDGVVNLLGPGVALDIEALIRELDEVKAKGVPQPRLFISDRAQVLMDFHVLFDVYEEERLSKNSFGSTKSGIAPFYSDKYAKMGIQLCQMLDKKLLKERLEISFAKKNVLLKHLYNKPELDAEKYAEKYYNLVQKIRPMIIDSTSFLRQAIKEGKSILLEGQLGSLRDPDHGIYPYVTSSSPLAGYASIGAGIPPRAIDEIIAVTKAYSSSVGTGSCPTMLSGSEAYELRKRGGDAGEFGAKTGRPRDVGWFDCVATRYGLEVQGATVCAMTNLDVLGYLDKIKLCVAYDINGKISENFPVTPLMKDVKPLYVELDGWKCDISDIRSYDELPENCKKYIDFIEKKLNVPIKILSNGPRREQIMMR